ncbi:hypothetical protein L873DRAFT_1807275 [Choiromyces venosus 120613-1]|uniref:Uncharacterized protein n=1 Tax=Choiromyces venosus 120613-1 TaxID=1336337 RepID=A0A3N4JZE9_9PEZI|nr:hypothetical protein L873DRAFT_1807275 [Choiromyces venosus 120613-1]
MPPRIPRYHSKPRQPQNEESRNPNSAEMAESGEQREEEAGSQSSMIENTPPANVPQNPQLLNPIETNFRFAQAAHPEPAELACVPEKRPASMGLFQRIKKSVHRMFKNLRRTDPDVEGLMEMSFLAPGTRAQPVDEAVLPPAETLHAGRPLYAGDIGTQDRVLSETFRRHDAAILRVWAG